MPSTNRLADARRRTEAAIVNEYDMKYMGFEIDGPVFRVNGKEYPINTAAAEVVTGAPTTSSRITVTRVVGGGLGGGVGGALLGGAAKKKTDTSKIYLTGVIRTDHRQHLSRPSKCRQIEPLIDPVRAC